MKHKDEASRSIVVQVQSSNSYKELYSYCNLHGTVNQMLHYSVGVDPMVCCTYSSICFFN